LKHGWTRSSRIASALLLVCLPVQALVRSCLAAAHVRLDSADSHRFDELTLAGLRPGRDVIAKAERLFSKPSAIGDNGISRAWQDPCWHELLSIIADSSGTILEIRVSEVGLVSRESCGDSGPNRWATGHGLEIGSACPRARALYGQPNSRGPSTKGGQQLELLYYAFDWAGPDVPQVMEVLCAPDRDGKPGRVVEITLAAPSL
jgi:hypothetical protein